MSGSGDGRDNGGRRTQNDTTLTEALAKAIGDMSAVIALAVMTSRKASLQVPVF